jgi:hypothetical protein
MITRNKAAFPPYFFQASSQTTGIDFRFSGIPN